MKSSKLKSFFLTLGLITSLLPCLSVAGPWLDVGDQRLRHDLQLLADAGLVHLPMQSWPLQAADVEAAVSRLSVVNIEKPALQRALSRVQSQVRRESRAGRWRSHLAGAATVNPEPFRSFNNRSREETKLEIGAKRMDNRLAIRLRGQWVNDPNDTNEWRLDDSYAAVILGNWGFSIDTMDRWWGPGWDGSLMLSSNARPFTKIAVRRNYSQPAQTPVLSWFGPWRWNTFLGMLDSRHASHSKPLVFGTRLESAPLPSLQLGLSSIAMFGGGSRDENLGALFDVYTGSEDDQGDNPGYQLTGADLRWRIPFIPLAVYGQYAGQSDEGSSAEEDMLLYGAETWLTLGKMGHSLRLQAEHADLSEASANRIYASNVYPDGYTNHGQSIGHSLGAGELDAVTLTWVTPTDSSFYLRGRNGAQTTNGTGQTTDYSEFQAGYEFRLPNGSRWSVDLGWRDFSNGSNNEDDSEWYGSFLIRRNF